MEPSTAMKWAFCPWMPNQTTKAQVIIIQTHGVAGWHCTLLRMATAKRESTHAKEGVSFYLQGEMLTSRCVSYKCRLDCQQRKVYSVSTVGRVFPCQDTQISAVLVKYGAPSFHCRSPQGTWSQSTGQIFVEGVNFLFVVCRGMKQHFLAGSQWWNYSSTIKLKLWSYLGGLGWDIGCQYAQKTPRNHGIVQS